MELVNFPVYINLLCRRRISLEAWINLVDIYKCDGLAIGVVSAIVQYAIPFLLIQYSHYIVSSFVARFHSYIMWY